MLDSFIYLPLIGVFLAFALVALFWSYCCLSFAGYLKSRAGLRTAYTRKIFHVLIFVSAVVVQGFGGFVAVCVFGMMVSIVVGHALLCGPGNRLYEALAREQDGPHRTYYIVVPYFATWLEALPATSSSDHWLWLVI